MPPVPVPVPVPVVVQEGGTSGRGHGVGHQLARRGGRRMYVIGLCTFAMCAVLAGFAPSLWALIAARALQATGGGIATPLGSAFLFRTFPPEKQGTALGVYGIGLLVAPAVGPILGGVLVDAGHWRWIFFLNVPIGLLGALWAAHVLPSGDADRKPSVDTSGIITSVVGFGALLYGASGWGTAETLVAFAVGLGGRVAFLLGVFLPGWPGKWSGRGGIEQDKTGGDEAAQHDGAREKGEGGEAGDSARPRPGARPEHLAPA